MSGAKFWRSAAVCAVVAAFAAGQQEVPDDTSDVDVVQAVPTDSADDGAGFDTVAPPALSVVDVGSAWLVRIEGVDPSSFRMLFLGLPDLFQAGFEVEFGYFGRATLGIAYPSPPIVLGYADGSDSILRLFAKPAPIPPEVVGYVIALQGLEAFLTTYYPDPFGPAYTHVGYRASSVATIEIR
jgi:hypothetical protein